MREWLGVEHHLGKGGGAAGSESRLAFLCLLWALIHQGFPAFAYDFAMGEEADEKRNPIMLEGRPRNASMEVKMKGRD